LSEKEGEEYVMDRIRDENFRKERKNKGKRKTTQISKSNEVKKNKVVELQKIIEDVAIKKGFSNLCFDKPEIDNKLSSPFLFRSLKMKEKL
jgi:hypothetical protein